MISASAPGKINLFFSVGRVRDDGYHDVYSVYQAIGLRDIVTIETSNQNSLFVHGNLNQQQLDLVPTDQSNICFLAAEKFFEYNELDLVPLCIQIEKHIPVAAGLAGGSADAAATLIALQELFETDSDLHSIASKIGADVPFSLLGGTALGSGSGVELEPIDAHQAEYLIAYPNKGISTKESFAYLDQLRENLQEIQLRIPGSDFFEDLKLGEKPTQLGQNDLTEPAVLMMPELAELIELGGFISGSGPSVYFWEPDATLISSLQESDFSWVLTSGDQPGARLGE
jgi:4-diphosphocytidyl-2-C-methyl-D-erythritol kinase